MAEHEVPGIAYRPVCDQCLRPVDFNDELNIWEHATGVASKRMRLVDRMSERRRRPQPTPPNGGNDRHDRTA